MQCRMLGRIHCLMQQRATQHLRLHIGVQRMQVWVGCLPKMHVPLSILIHPKHHAPAIPRCALLLRDH